MTKLRQAVRVVAKGSVGVNRKVEALLVEPWEAEAQEWLALDRGDRFLSSLMYLRFSLLNILSVTCAREASAYATSGRVCMDQVAIIRAHLKSWKSASVGMGRSLVAARCWFAMNPSLHVSRSMPANENESWIFGLLSKRCGMRR